MNGFIWVLLLLGCCGNGNVSNCSSSCGCGLNGCKSTCGCGNTMGSCSSSCDCNTAENSGSFCGCNVIQPRDTECGCRKEQKNCDSGERNSRFTVNAGCAAPPPVPRRLPQENTSCPCSE